MRQTIILAIGTGRCGLASLAKVLNQQTEAQCSYEEPPWLPWRVEDACWSNSGSGAPSPLASLPAAGNEHAAVSASPPLPIEAGSERTRRILQERFARFRLHGTKRLLGDAASFYLPYLEEVIAVEPDVRIVCLKRPRAEVIGSFCEWNEQAMPLPTNHWAVTPAPGWHHDPNRTRIYPQYDTPIREEGIGRYWDEYSQRVEALQRRFPEYIRTFDTYEALNTEQGLRELLSFVGIPPEQQVLAVGTRLENIPERPRRPVSRRPSGDPMDPRRCVILVPFATSILPPCERALEELERRGYAVRRVGGYAAIDQGRNQMATDAILDGYEETLWIDSDVEFHPDAIDRLRWHGLPIVCGIYPQKGKRALASHVMPGTPKMVFGKEGGLVEILYAGAGFLLVRREVYLTIQRRLRLPMCNERFRIPLIPFFYPMLHACEDGCWYLAEDYAFCERARQCGFKVMADTSIRLWHIGSQAYGWEDAGRERERFDTFTLNFGPGPEPARENGEPRPTVERREGA